MNKTLFIVLLFICGVQCVSLAIDTGKRNTRNVAEVIYNSNDKNDIKITMLVSRGPRHHTQEQLPDSQSLTISATLLSKQKEPVDTEAGDESFMYEEASVKPPTLYSKAQIDKIYDHLMENPYSRKDIDKKDIANFYNTANNNPTKTMSKQNDSITPDPTSLMENPELKANIEQVFGSPPTLKTEEENIQKETKGSIDLVKDLEQQAIINEVFEPPVAKFFGTQEHKPSTLDHEPLATKHDQTNANSPSVDAAGLDLAFLDVFGTPPPPTSEPPGTTDPANNVNQPDPPLESKLGTTNNADDYRFASSNVIQKKYLTMTMTGGCGSGRASFFIVFFFVFILFFNR